MILPTPIEFGAPVKYAEWRHGQDTAMQKLLLSSKRFSVLALPTGIGKSLMGIIYALFTQGKAVVLTRTKGLQDQYMADFAEAGLVDSRGMGNYECKADPRRQCDEADCLDGGSCWMRQNGCLYYDALREARKSPLVVTNYAMWLAQKRVENGGFGKTELLIMDEAHDAAAELSSFLRVEIGYKETAYPQNPQGLELGQWKEWAEGRAGSIEIEVSGMPMGWARREKKNLLDRLKRLANASGDWVAYPNHRGWSWEPLWPAPYAEEYYFDGIPHVILVSATIRPKSLRQLGLTSADYDWIECPSPFPAGRRPVYHVPTIRMNAKVDDGALGIWVDRIDQVIEGRLDRKGIIHTVSYDRAKFLKRRSRYGYLMLTHETETARSVIEQFKRGPAPAILVSPSVTTGYDFPYEQAQWQIIGKLAFPDTRVGINRARQQEDGDYSTYCALTQLVQAAGRGMRAPDDVCETFVLDDTIRSPWISRKYREFLPQWFLSAFRSVASVPVPPPLDLPSIAVCA